MIIDLKRHARLALEFPMIVKQADERKSQISELSQKEVCLQ